MDKVFEYLDGQKSESEINKIRFFQNFNNINNRQIFKVTEAHKYMDYYFDDWNICFENGDFINTENCPEWNDSCDNRLSVAIYYLTTKGIKL